MMDLMVLAFWTDTTRIATFMFGNEVTGQNFSFVPGVNGSHHEISHHENKPDKLEMYKKIGIWHIEQMAYMFDSMKAIKEGPDTLLDNSMVLFGSGIRDGNAHDPHDLPVLLGGKGGKTIKTGPPHRLQARNPALQSPWRHPRPARICRSTSSRTAPGRSRSWWADQRAHAGKRDAWLPPSGGAM
jgi:hypothetical protein